MGRERDLLFGIAPQAKTKPPAPKARPRGRKKARHACSVPGCGASFGDVFTLREHEAIPHEQCPFCHRFYRCLAVHRAASSKKKRKDARQCAALLASLPVATRLP